MQLVWATDRGRGEQIYFSSLETKGWTSPVQVSKSAELVFHPSAGSGDDGEVWVAWVRKGKHGNVLEYSVGNSSGWAPPSPVETVHKMDNEVTVVVDRSNTPWIAWTGTEEDYPEIFWSRWNGEGWSVPARAHAANSVPDLDPQLALDDGGQVVLSWQTFTDGRYERATRIWDGIQWQEEKSPEPGAQVHGRSADSSLDMPALPDFIQDPRKASLFIKDGAGSRSVPVR